MDKIEVFIRNVLSAWTLLLFIQKQHPHYSPKAKLKKAQFYAVLTVHWG